MKTMNINTTLLPKLQRVLKRLGEQLQLARLRRELSRSKIAERAGVSLSTLEKIEKGFPSVSFGAYAQVLLVLGMEQDILLLAKDDELGRKIQDLGLTRRKRAPKRSHTKNEN